MSTPKQNLVSVFSLTLGPGASGSVLHGIRVEGVGAVPSQVLCDRASPIRVTGADADRVYFTNGDASAAASAVFRVELDHSVLVTGAPPLFWNGGPTSLPPSGPAGGDLDGTYPDPIVVGLEGIPIEPAPPANGDALLYNSATHEWTHSPIIFSGGPPTGPAGGSLAGLYPDPSIAAGAVSDVEVAAANKDGAAGTPSMRTLGTGAQQACAGNDARLSNPRTPIGVAGGDLDQTYPNPRVVGFASEPINTSAPAAGEYWRFDGATWQHVAVSPGTPAAVYGQFYSNIDQLIADGASSVSTIYAESGSGVGVTCVAAPTPGAQKTRLTVASAGVYSFTISPQLKKGSGAGGGVAQVSFWARKNGNDEPETASFVEVKNNEHMLPFVELILSMGAGDFLEWVAHANLADVSLEQEPAAPNPAAPSLTRPAAPSVIFGVKLIGV